MDEKGTLTMPAELVKRIDEGRGEQSQSEFLGSLVDSYLERESWAERFVTQEAFREFEQGMKGIMRSFLDFFISYELELGQRPGEGRKEALNQRLQRLSTTPSNGSKGKPKG